MVGHGSWGGVMSSGEKKKKIVKGKNCLKNEEPNKNNFFFGYKLNKCAWGATLNAGGKNKYRNVGSMKDFSL